MRTTATTLAAGLALASSLVFAQPAPSAPARTLHDPFSPLVYDALGATPSIQLRKSTSVPAAAKAPVEATTPTAARAQDKATTSAAKAVSPPAQATAPSMATTH